MNFCLEKGKSFVLKDTFDKIHPYLLHLNPILILNEAEIYFPRVSINI